MCKHKLNGVRNRGYANEYRQCVLCKKKIYKYSIIKRFIALNRTWNRLIRSQYEKRIVDMLNE